MISFFTNLLSANAELAITLVKIGLLLFIVLTVNAYLTWFERKVVAHMQSRWGPHRTGPHGLLQPLADGVKFLFKEDPTPAGVDKFVYYLAPLLALALALTGIALIPFGPDPLPKGLPEISVNWCDCGSITKPVIPLSELVWLVLLLP